MKAYKAGQAGAGNDAESDGDAGDEDNNGAGSDQDDE